MNMFVPLLNSLIAFDLIHIRIKVRISCGKVMNMFVTLAWKRSVNLVLVFSNIWQKTLANEYRLVIILYSRLKGLDSLFIILVRI